jgi:hypothetical protein
MAAGRGNLLQALQIPDDPPAAVRIDESAARIGDADHSFLVATVQINDPPTLLGSGMAARRGNLLRALQIHDDPPAAVRIDESAARIGDANHSFPAVAVRIDNPPALLGSGMAAGRGSLL